MRSLKRKRQLYAEAYSAGDIKVGLITGEYPNVPAVFIPAEKGPTP